jgi:hypothetical protein
MFLATALSSGHAMTPPRSTTTKKGASDAGGLEFAESGFAVVEDAFDNPQCGCANTKFAFASVLPVDNALPLTRLLRYLAPAHTFVRSGSSTSEVAASRPLAPAE